MKKTMMAMAMAAMTMMATGTALAATPERGYCRESVPSIETSYAHCGGGDYGRHHDGYHGHRGHGSGYCYGYESSEG